MSNWATSAGQRCVHNMLYWQGADWWGVGPGAHSHVGGTRWWNVKHPSAYTARVADGQSPAHAREVLTEGQRRFERVLLGTRLVTGTRSRTCTIQVGRQCRRWSTAACSTRGPPPRAGAC